MSWFAAPGAPTLHRSVAWRQPDSQLLLLCRVVIRPSSVSRFPVSHRVLLPSGLSPPCVSSLDLFLNFFIGFHDVDGQVVLDLSRIANRPARDGPNEGPRAHTSKGGTRRGKSRLLKDVWYRWAQPSSLGLAPGLRDLCESAEAFRVLGVVGRGELNVLRSVP